MRMHTSISAIITLFTASLLLFLSGSIPAYADRSPGDLNALKPGAARTDTIVPDQWLQGWDPVTVFFKSTRGPVDPKFATNPTDFVSMVPAHPGGWRWLNSRTLQFVPVEPWQPFTTYTVKAGRAAVDLHTVLPAPGSTLPVHGDVNVPRLETIEMEFSQVVDADLLADHITLQLWNAPTASGSPRQELDASDFGIKQIQSVNSGKTTRYLLTLNTPVADNTRVKMQIDLANVQSDRFRYLLDFTTARYFSVISAGADSQWLPVDSAGDRESSPQRNRSPLILDTNPPVFKLRFSAPPQPRTPTSFWDLVHISPDVENLTFTIKDRVLAINGAFEPDVVYTATLRPTSLVEDSRGRGLHLESPVTVPFMYQKPETALSWNQGMAVLERYGARMLPVNGRGNQVANLRIYKIDPLDRTLWPFPQGGISVEPDKQPENALTRSGKYHDQTWYLSDWELKKALRTMGSPAVSELVKLPLNPMGRSRVYGLDVADYLKQIDGKDAPGTYLAGIQTVDSPGLRHWMRFQVTDLAATTIEDGDEVIILVTSLSSGRPVANARVVIEGYRSSKWERVVEGKTDAMGVVTLSNPDRERYINTHRIRVERGSDGVVFNPDKPPKLFRHGRWSQEGDWLYSAINSTNTDETPKYVSHTFTERPVYRPGEQVHIRGWLRRRDGGKLAVQKGSVVLDVSGPGDMQWREVAKLSANGGFYVGFQPEDTPAGYYRVTVLYRDRHVGSAEFSMEDYRIPTFEVLLHGEDTVSLDAPFDISMTAAYYAGGVMADRPVDWMVTQDLLEWKMASLPGYTFASDDLFSGRPELDTDVVLEQHVETDATGASSITIDPVNEPSLSVRSYTVEATVTGVDEQTVTTVKRVEALPAFMLGMKAPRVVEPGKPLRTDLVVVGTDDAFQSGREIMVRLIHRTWHTALKAGNYARDALKYETHIVDTPLDVQTVVSADGPLTVTFPAQEAGVYVLEASSWDRLGRAQIVRMDTFVHGDSPVTWERSEDRRFIAKFVKDPVKPGQTAKIILESPFQTAEAIAVVEAPDTVHLIHTSVRNGTGAVHVPVEATWCPEIPINILLMRGRIQGSRLDLATGIDLGKPQTLGTSLTLHVSDERHQLNVAVNHPKRARPGETITLKMKLTDATDRPVSGEAAVWLVDRAVLALGREYTLNPLEDILLPWPSRVKIRDTREFTLGQLPWMEKTGGGFGEMAAVSSLFDRQSLRKKFKAVPFYDPFVEIGADGTADIAVELPDNLTQFAVRVKAVSGADRFGFAASRLAVSLPVVMQPTLPRFLRPDDLFKAMGVARLVEGEATTGTAAISVDGLTVDGADSVPVSLALNSPVRTDFTLRVPEAGYDESGEFTGTEVSIRMAVERDSDQAGDAVQVDLPVKDGARMFKETIFERLQPAQSTIITGVDTESVRPGSSSRHIHLTNSPLINLALQARSQLRQYPYQCTEQRVSRVSGLLAMEQLNQTLDLPEDPDLNTLIEQVTHSIGSSVTPSGLVAFWPGGKGYVHLTARVLRYLAMARKAGYDIDPVIIEQLSETLKKSLRSDNPYLLSDYVYLERCMALEALNVLGQKQTAYLEELARMADTADIESLARITRLLHGMDGVDPARIESLLNRILDDVIFETIDGELTATALRGSCYHPFVLHSDITALAEILRTLLTIHPDDSRIDPMIRGVLNMVRSKGLTTYLSESLILLISDYFSVTGFMDRSEITINGRTVSLGGDDKLVTIIDDGLQDVAVTHVSGDPVTVSAAVVGYPRQSPSEINTTANGYAVNRSWRKIADDGNPGVKVDWTDPGTTLQLQVGDIIEEEIQVVNAENRNYVVIEIPLAAGFEPLNPQLATAPREAIPAGKLTLSPEYMALRDDHVAYYYNTLPRGTYSFYFRSRAAFEGVFNQPGAWASSMYSPEETGGSPGAFVEIQAAQ